MNNELFKTKDKQIAPYLLTQSRLNFEGIKVVGTTVFFRFSPFDIASSLTNKYLTHKADPVDPKILLEAVETYRNIIFEQKEKTNSGI